MMNESRKVKQVLQEQFFMINFYSLSILGAIVRDVNFNGTVLIWPKKNAIILHLSLEHTWIFTTLHYWKIGKKHFEVVQQRLNVQFTHHKTLRHSSHLYLWKLWNSKI